ncbi:MAG: Hint domain-containing protein [Roseovarius sp.]|nr:Hint domain-containing protein [Roseovarius sp.]
MARCAAPTRSARRYPPSRRHFPPLPTAPRSPRPAAPVPVEDLVPGMKLVTQGHGALQLQWTGSMTLVPRSDRFPDAVSLTRITAGSFGPGRPQSDIMAGPGARFLLRPAGFFRPSRRRARPDAGIASDRWRQRHRDRAAGPGHRLPSLPAPARDHLGRGMQAESYHPGAGFERSMGPRMLSLFLSFFPHVKQPRDFGPLACQRLPLDDTAPADVACD